jgi:hypothetical protein
MVGRSLESRESTSYYYPNSHVSGDRNLHFVRFSEHAPRVTGRTPFPQIPPVVNSTRVLNQRSTQ